MFYAREHFIYPVTSRESSSNKRTNLGSNQHLWRRTSSSRQQKVRVEVSRRGATQPWCEWHGTFGINPNGKWKNQPSYQQAVPLGSIWVVWKIDSVRIKETERHGSRSWSSVGVNGSRSTRKYVCVVNPDCRRWRGVNKTRENSTPSGPRSSKKY